MSNLKAMRAAGLKGCAAAGDVLRLFMASMSAKDKAFMLALFKEGQSLELVYGGILGKEPHVRIMVIGTDGTPREMLRIQLV